MNLSDPKTNLTSDETIRSVLIHELSLLHSNDTKVRIIEEFGVKHGSARIDIAVVNGIMHGYEIKSDKDTLNRLPEQMEVYNTIFDRVTLIVGKKHVIEAINLVPDWWGISIAKFDIQTNKLIFNCIREAYENPQKNCLSIARLLWREEALQILEEIGYASGLRSKPRNALYERLSQTLDQKTLSDKVRERIFFRQDWRADSPLVLNDD